MSRQIKRLETDLGRPLFERHVEGLRLTPSGERYFRVVQRFLRDLSDETARLRRRGDSRQLTLASSPTIASIWLARQLPAFQRAHPHIEIRILTVEDPHRLDLGEFDLGIYYHVPFEVDPPGLTAHAIFADEEVGAVCSPIYLERHGKHITPEALLTDHTLMVVEDHYHDWLTWEIWFNELGLAWQPPEHTLRANSFQLLMNATLAGQGVTLGWMRLLEAEIRQGNLVPAMAHRLPSRGRLSLFTPEHRHMTEPMKAFQKWVLSGETPPQDH